MKRFLMLASMYLLVSPVASAEVEPSSMPRRAVVEAVTCGEIDPVVVGEACLALVHAENGEALGLVAPLDLLESHPYEELAELIGQNVDLEPAALEPVGDAEAIDVLGAPGVERRFFWWNGSWRVEH